MLFFDKRWFCSKVTQKNNTVFKGFWQKVISVYEQKKQKEMTFFSNVLFLHQKMLCCLSIYRHLRFFCPILVKQRATSRLQKKTSDFFLHGIKEGFVLFFAKKSNKIQFCLFFCCTMLNRSITLASSCYCLVFTKKNPQVSKKMQETQKE